MAASKKLLCDFADCQQGTIAIVSAVLLTVIMGSSALGVDLASVYFQKRIAQGVVDLAAMNAASHPDRADEAVAATIDANRLAGVHRIEIHKGFYAADRAVAAANRFKPDAAPVNAVRVTFRSLAPLYFARALGFDEAPISVSATAGTSNAATFSVGSRLASLNGGLANSLLSALTGSTVSLSAMDYRALVNADIRVDGFLNSIAERAHITAGTYRDVLDAKLTMGEVAGAVASRLRVDGNGDAALSVERFAGQVSGSSRKLQIKSLVGASDYANITVGRTHPGLGALLSVFEVMRAAAVLSNGKRQVTVDLELGIPGISRSELTLAIGEPAQYSAWASVGQSGALVRTAQTKLRLVNTIDAPAGLGIASITLPIFAEAAYADAALDSVRCGSSGRDPEATIATTPGIARVAIAHVSDGDLETSEFGRPLSAARIVSTNLLNVSALTQLAIGNGQAAKLSFTQNDVDQRVVKTTETNSYLDSLLTSLLQRTKLTVRVLGLLSLGAPQADAAVMTKLGALAQPLDAVIYDVLKVAGIHLGEADVQVHGIRCGAATIVD